MGPAGSGKTTVGSDLARRLGWRFIEGDDRHPEANVRKMASGHPLTDEDRRPWLETLADELRRAAGQNENVVLACSALKESYREKLRVHHGVSFVFLDAPLEVLERRLKGRKGHFLPPSLLGSQLAALERPGDALRVDASRPVAEIVDDIAARVPRG
jgi:gluconokinase